MVEFDQTAPVRPRASGALRLTASVLLIATVAPPARAVYYNATILQPAAFQDSVARGISATNQIGSGSPLGEDGEHALLWTGTAASVVDLNPSGFNESSAFATSGANQGGHGYGPATGGQNHALLWNGTAASAVDLNPSDFDGSIVSGISGSTQVGSGYGGSTNNVSHALLWTGTAASKVDLHPSGYFSSEATGASGNKQVGNAQLATGHIHASLWTGTAASRVDLTPSGWEDSEVYGVTGTGATAKEVGSAADDILTNNHFHAMLWTGTATSKVDLHPTALNVATSVAYAISAAGQVGYGHNETGAGFDHAIYWNGTAASAVDLQPFLSGLTPSFTASYAYGISDAGTIVGYAISSSNTTFAVMWTPVVESGVPGDYNNDHTVNIADYLVWRKKNGTTFQLMNEVAGTTPGQVTTEDFTAWRARFGNVAGSGNSEFNAVAIPEPSTLALALLLCAALFAQQLVPRPTR